MAMMAMMAMMSTVKIQWSVNVDQVGAFDDAGIENVENIRDKDTPLRHSGWMSCMMSSAWLINDNGEDRRQQNYGAKAL